MKVIIWSEHNQLFRLSVHTLPMLANTSKVMDGLFVNDLGPAGWLHTATDTGLHGLNLSTFVVFPYLNGINMSVTSLVAWSPKEKDGFCWRRN